jgi:hypothetical protein
MWGDAIVSIVGSAYSDLSGTVTVTRRHVTKLDDVSSKAARDHGHA